MYSMLNRKCVYSALCFVYFLFRFVASGREILTVKSNAVTHVESRDVVLSGSGTRWRRSTMSQQEMERATAIHNTVRRREGASDMEYMTWSNVLASMAQDWADGCDFVHGQPRRDPSTLPYRDIGQNLFYTTGALNVTDAIENEWYDEKQFYDYDTLACKAEEQCGHYTQVVWSSSREVGCAYSLCSNLIDSNDESTIGRAKYLVCNYGPPGNYRGAKPFKKGKACSTCGSGVNWCNDGLCNRNCRHSGPGCDCAATCLNCGSINKDTCICSCAPGWYGTNCMTKCADVDGRCNDYPRFYCDRPQVRQSCPVKCKLCQVANGTESLTCGSPSLLHSIQTSSLSLIIAAMTLVAMTSLTTWTMDSLR